MSSPLLLTKGAKSSATALMKVNNKPPRSCPRCSSKNTKFCYFNNYSANQPRYFCRTCDRYWTHGGLLRDIPYGGSSRKCKRPRYAPPNNKRRRQPAAVITAAHGYEVPMLRNVGRFFSPRVESSNFHFLLQGFGHLGPFEFPEFPPLTGGGWAGGNGGVGGGMPYWAPNP